MNGDELTQQLAKQPGACQKWITFRPIRGDGGAVYLSQIINGPEKVGVVHICIWNKSSMGRPDAVRGVASDLMQDYELDRLTCEINIDNNLARRLAKKAGLREIGIIRQRKNERGQYDVILMDALPGDLNGRRKESI